MRYKVQVFGWALIWSGLLVFGYVGFQLFVTDWMNAGVQAAAAESLEPLLATPAPPGQQVDTDDIFEGRDPPPEVPEVVERFDEDAVPAGDSFALLSIPAIGLDQVVVYEGVDRETLKKGPGHIPRTPLPGQPGNAVISGHRTTYGRPFFDLDQLERGDEIEVETAIGTHVYEIRDIEVVLPTDVWVTDARDGGWLTLTTCEPKFSARRRLVVFAELVSGPNYEFIQLNQL